jgi:serine/threonine protein kinase
MKQADQTPEALGLSATASRTSGQAPDDERVIEAMHEYLAALEAGQNPDRAAFLARYPAIAEELADCLEGLEFVHGLGPHADEPESPASRAGLSASSSASEFAPEGPLGDYRIVRQIGQGGMGVVYEAVQISLGRRVALKVLPFAAALDPRQRQRFQNEAHAAAQLHHTHIVPVYGVGSARGIHYYAMQFIDGQTLAQMIADCRLQIADLKKDPSATGAGQDKPEAPICNLQSAICNPTVAALSTERSARTPAFFRTIANLGIQAAEALEHAHQFGIYHRDIKPANLLVENSPLASDPSPLRLWITDFGLAHCRSQAGLTMTGDLVGTLRYMSPEQALAKRVLIDHRTDIYSLGATLYELLTLEPVFSGSERQELLRQIAFEEPRMPHRLNSAIPRELETIVLKALEKNPAERYGTAQEMADDLRRYLEDKPIWARRPTVLSRVRKWSRRHRGVVTATVVSTILALTVGLVLMGWQWRVAEDRRDRAEKAEAAAKESADQARKAEAAAKKAAAQLKTVNDFLTQDLLHQASPDKNPVNANVTIRQLLDRASKRVDENKSIAAQPEVEAMIRNELGNTYNDLGLGGEAKRHLDRALELCRRVHGEKHEHTLGVRVILASNAFLRGDLAEGEKLCRRNLPDLREVVGPRNEATLFTMTLLAGALEMQGKVDEAETLVREVYETGRKGAETYETLRAGHSLAGLLYGRGQLDQAEALIRENLKACRRFHGSDDHPEVLVALQFLPMILHARGQWDEAERKYREADKICRHVLGAEQGDTIGNMYNLAVLLHARGKWSEAEPLFRETVLLYRKMQPKHQYMALTLYAWGNLLSDKGEFKEAEPALREALGIQRHGLVQDHYCTGQTAAALGWALTKTGRAKEGEPLLREGLEICRTKLPKKDWFTADTQSLLGGCLAAQRQYEKAERLLLNGYKGLQTAAGTPPVTDSWPIRCMLTLHDSPGAPPARIRQALDRIIALYEAWEEPDKAAEWRAKRTTPKTKSLDR